MADIDDVSLAQLQAGTLMERMGITVGAVTAERAVGSMPVEGNTQPYGLLHGGASAVLAETLGSYAAMAHAQPDGIAVGVDLSITHHRAVREGTVRGEATALHRGRTVASYAITIEDESGRPVATARLTCAIRQRAET
ncbi:PaaI family thioesterase [Demequina sp. NBRC 110056]|uniref:PaaI family thioesterase n=1 Tax=Demequina sp. NBRC 110056 TaxID=1570345 RepID=UPI000A007DA0|nr:PaaI family thioesterase [Demequina sp. NBRC 110056]